ncbi:LysR family transcriptional regulator [Christensenellaceae bacterium OttesenSCG-928-M15]|nr:LysR family transcriptional regulator [Christensenellaceae bacterium OttesenSCG-928-M15]
MNLYHLRYFLKLGHLQHYTRAAAELNITQPSLSNAIAQLEAELGVPLFEKEGRNIVITKYGRLFLKDVEQALEILDEGVNNIRVVKEGGGRIDIGFLRTLGTDYIPSVARSFLEENEGKKIDFHFHTGVTADLIEGLEEKIYDMAVCSMMEEKPHIEFIPVNKQELVLVVPNDHPLARHDTVDLRDTLEYPMIAYKKKSGLRAVVDGLYKKVGRYPDIASETEEDQVIAGMAANGFGIAIVPKMDMLDALPLKKLPITYPSFERLFYLAMRKGDYRPPVVEAFRQYMLEHSRVYPPHIS